MSKMLEENVGRIFEIFRDQEIESDIARRIEMVIRRGRSIIGFDEIDEALNWMIRNDYVIVDSTFNGKEWVTRIKFRKTKPRKKTPKRIMPDCDCEGSCPVCRIGEVDNHKCGRCETKFCPKCHGIISGIIPSPNVKRCKCADEKQGKPTGKKKAARKKK